MSYKSVARRKSLRRKQEEPRSWLQVFLVFILCASVLFAFAILLGNFLRNVADNGPDDDAPEADPSGNTGYFDISAVPVIVAEYCSNAEAAEGNLGSGAIRNTRSPIQYNAVSLLLRTKKSSVGSSAQTYTPSAYASTVKKTGMRLQYTSEFASLEPFDDPGTENIAKVIGEAKKKYGYVSGAFEIGFFNEPAVTRYLVREYEISLLCELSDCGLDDAVLTGASEQDLPDVIEFIRDARKRTNGKLKLGIAMDFAYFEAKDIKNKVNALHFDCGFFAIDLRSETVPTMMTPENFVYDRIGRIASTVSLYSVRVMVGIGPESGYRTEAESAFKAGSLNIMTVPGPTVYAE